MQTHQKGLLFKEREFFWLEYFPLWKWNWLELSIMKMENIVDQMKVHVLVHVSILKTLAGETRSKEEIWLNIDIESSMFVTCNTPVKICLISLHLPDLRRKSVHSFTGLMTCKWMKFLKSDCFQWRAISFLSIDDETNFLFGFRLVCSEQAFLESSSKDNILWSCLFFSKRERQLVVEVIIVHSDNSDILINANNKSI